MWLYKYVIPKSILFTSIAHETRSTTVVNYYCNIQRLRRLNVISIIITNKLFDCGEHYYYLYTYCNQLSVKRKKSQ